MCTRRPGFGLSQSARSLTLRAFSSADNSSALPPPLRAFFSANNGVALPLLELSTVRPRLQTFHLLQWRYGWTLYFLALPSRKDGKSGAALSRGAAASFLDSSGDCVGQLMARSGSFQAIPRSASRT